MLSRGSGGFAVRLCRFLSRHAAWVLAAGVLIGLAAPEWPAVMRPWLAPAVGGLLFISILRVRWPEFAGAMARPGRMGVLVIWVLLASPALAWAVLWPLPLSPAIKVAIVLMAATPPLFSSPAMALLWGLDAPLMLAIVVVTTVVGPFTLVVVASTLAGFDLGVAPLDLMLSLSALVGGCFVLALIARAIAGGDRVDGAAPAIDTVMLALLLVFAIGVMDGVPQRFAAEPRFVWLCLGVSFAANVLLQAGGVAATWWLGRKPALTVGFSSGNRSMGLLLAVAPAEYGSRHRPVLRTRSTSDVHAARAAGAVVPVVAAARCRAVATRRPGQPIAARVRLMLIP